MLKVSKIADPNYVRDQYQDASNFNARVQLHKQCSTNPQGWQFWVFDQLNLPAACRILELGCGPGELWRDNLERIPPGWDITLSDLSSGMVEQAQENLSGRFLFRFEVIDAQSIPFEDEHFDAVIANHMLYHVPDRNKALAEIRRVLKQNGRFYATTVGQNHLHEMAELVERFDPELAEWGARPPSDSFLLENGTEQLIPWFAHISLHHHEDALVVTEVAPLVAYVLSGRLAMNQEKEAAFTQFVAQELAQHGAIHITKDSGLFECHPGRTI